DRSAVPPLLPKDRAVEITERRLRRIHARTLGAGLRHGGLVEGGGWRVEGDWSLHPPPSTLNLLLDDHLQLHRPNLNDVIGLQRHGLTRVDLGAIYEGAVGAVQIFYFDLAVFQRNQGVLPRGPDAIRRLLVF